PASFLATGTQVSAECGMRDNIDSRASPKLLRDGRKICAIVDDRRIRPLEESPPRSPTHFARILVRLYIVDFEDDLVSEKPGPSREDSQERLGIKKEPMHVKHAIAACAKQTHLQEVERSGVVEGRKESDAMTLRAEFVGVELDQVVVLRKHHDSRRQWL